MQTTTQLVIRLFKFLPAAVAKGAQRVLLFWRGGMYTYLGISLFVVYSNRSAITAVLRSPGWSSLVGLFVAVGTDIGTAAFTAVTALTQALPAASGVGYIGAVWTVLVSVITISWYFRTSYVVARMVEGGDVSPLLVIIFAAPLYLALVVVAVLSGDVQMTPVAQLVEAAGNLDLLFEWERVMPGLDGNVSNVTQSIEPASNATSQ